MERLERLEEWTMMDARDWDIWIRERDTIIWRGVDQVARAEQRKRNSQDGPTIAGPNCQDIPAIVGSPDNLPPSKATPKLKAPPPPLPSLEENTAHLVKLATTAEGKSRDESTASAADCWIRRSIYRYAVFVAVARDAGNTSI